MTMRSAGPGSPPYAPTDAPSLSATTPQWFDWAVNTAVDSNYVEHNGCPIHYLRWASEHDESTAAGVLFLHGGGAHANWWRFIAPFFTATAPTIAMDLSGMGDSGHRESYNATIRAGEIHAVLHDAGFFEPGRKPPYIVGHSFGGLTAMRYASLYGAQMGGFVIAEAPVRPPDVEAKAFNARPEGQPPSRSYDSFEEALARFRLLPKQSCENDFIVEWIARHSIRKVEGGWSWKFDPRALGRSRHAEPFRDYLGKVGCRSVVMYGDKSKLLTPDTIDYMIQLLAPHTPVIAVPQGQHHLFLDEPLACVTAVRVVLDMWDRQP
jgi:pimeloyl-ACP methyl ester carboxylesterase